MPIIGYGHNFALGLSDFWQRFFADSDQLANMYDGSAVLMGQAYLDMLQNVLSLSLQDTSIYHKQYFQLVTIREDEVSLQRGAAVDDDRWLVSLADGLVAFSGLDNKVFEPTASLQKNSDYNLSETDIRFKQDPTDPAHDGVPLPGYARRALDVAVGGQFDDTTRPPATTWMSRNIYKGDTLRLLDVLSPQQRKKSDHGIVLVRAKGFYVAESAPLPSTTAAQNYVILRRPEADEVILEPLVFTPPTGVPAVATLAHTRLDQGSVRLFSRRSYDGQDVVENIDYTIDYELGKVYKIVNTTANPLSLDWQATAANKANYTWQQEVWPIAGGTPPRFSTTGVVRSSNSTVRVLQIALWALDAAVDRKTLANNFGALIGFDEPSSEAYRALLRGIFQLYILGPVLERIESALNVILGFPVIRDDGEVLVSVDLLLPDVNRITTRRPVTNALATYDFPKATPLRPDIIAAPPGSLTFLAFEPLTIAITVTDYIEDPTWWHGTVIPEELFAVLDGAALPSPARRTASPFMVKHVAGAEDMPLAGDPGLIAGADEEGVIPPPGHPVFRHRFAFVIMNRFFKFHTFVVRFNPAVLTGLSVGNKFERSLEELNTLVRNAKPAHTFVFVTPTTKFSDLLAIAESQFYQPQRFLGADPDAPEIYPNPGALPDISKPYVELGVFLGIVMGSPAGGDDKVQFADQDAVVGAGIWTAGDYFHYELNSDTVSFPTVGLPVAIAGAPLAPRHARFVRVFVAGAIGGKALVENIDYTVNYATRTVTRLTAWAAIVAIVVTYVQANIGNVSDAPADVTVGDVPVLTGNNDPATARAVYDPAAVDWLGVPIPVTNHRDLSMVERALTLKIT